MAAWLWALVAVVVLLLLAAVLLLVSASLGERQTRAASRRLAEVFPGQTPAPGVAEEDLFTRMFGELGRTRIAAGAAGMDRDELRSLILQAGYGNQEGERIFRGLALAGPPGGMALALLSAPVLGWGLIEALLGVFVGFALGYLAPRYWLRYRAGQRRAAIAAEIPVLVHILKILFDSGLSLEHSLRVLVDQGELLVPEMRKESQRLLVRLNTGMAREEALKRLADEIPVDELRDLVTVLTQASRVGGSIRHSLERLVENIEDRQRTTLQERVNKLAGKMTIVMVVFMFPALLIFLAGPGFLGLIQALSGASGN